MLCVAVGMLVGLVNGVLITRFRVAPFIATLGMLYVARGLALLISNGTTIPDWPAARSSATPVSASSAAGDRSGCPPRSG